MHAFESRSRRVGFTIAAAATSSLLAAPGCTPTCACKLRGQQPVEPARCSLSSEALHSRQQTINDMIADSVRRWRDLPDGFAFEFPGELATARLVFETILLERRCCGFVQFTLSFEPDLGPTWLEMRTDPQEKSTLRQLLLPTGVFDALQFSGLNPQADG